MGKMHQILADNAVSKRAPELAIRNAIRDTNKESENVLTWNTLAKSANATQQYGVEKLNETLVLLDELKNHVGNNSVDSEKTKIMLDSVTSVQFERISNAMGKLAEIEATCLKKHRRCTPIATAKDIAGTDFIFNSSSIENNSNTIVEATDIITSSIRSIIPQESDNKKLD